MGKKPPELAKPSDEKTLQNQTPRDSLMSLSQPKQELEANQTISKKLKPNPNFGFRLIPGSDSSDNRSNSDMEVWETNENSKDKELPPKNKIVQSPPMSIRVPPNKGSLRLEQKNRLLRQSYQMNSPQDLPTPALLKLSWILL